MKIIHASNCLIALIMLTGYTLAKTQTFTDEQRLKGYVVDGQKVTFIFDETIYRVKPERVVVTGPFRGWSQEMNDTRWTFSKNGHIWTLKFDNPDFEVISPQTPFKFRTDEGHWIQPIDDAPNESHGNLIFMEDVMIAKLKAELRNEYLIWAEVTGERPLKGSDYRIVDAKGHVIKVAGVLPNGGGSVVIRPEKALDRKRVYYLEIPRLGLRAHCSFDGWFRTLYSTKEMGANIQGNSTIIRIFAPRAEKVVCYLYKGKDDKKAYREEVMKIDEQGVWELLIDENLHGIYYDFTVHGSDDPGNHFYETNPVHITDPYARVSDDTWGKARIWENTKPATPLKGGRPKMQDVIAYEVHVQDFTGQLPIPEDLKGTFKGMITPGLRNSRGEKIGFDYLLDLGINVVHLMPVQEYLHFPTDDWKASFQDDPYMIAQGVSEENYQWGYRTSHFFAVESRYRTQGKAPGEERNEFRDLVQAFHNHGIAVIIDIVPNHTAENMDGNEFFFNFNALDKQYYYRTRELDHIGEYGNEVKTENRPMTQRWLIDQCMHFINEFGIDGFRIDLAGQIDQQTLKALKETLGPDVIVYGEAWIGSNDPDYESNPDWDWYKNDSPITFFQDDARNAFKGPVFELNDEKKDRGWPGGKFDERMNVMRGLANKFPDDKTPLSGINYLDIHDNFALADQFGMEGFKGLKGVYQDEYKMAATLLYTSLGPIVTHGGSEIMRSKALAPLGEVIKETKAGFKIYMHGYRDTYNHRKANEFVWESVGQEATDGRINDYRNMHAFWKGLNQLRMSDYGQVFRVDYAVDDNYFRWIAPEELSTLGYIVDRTVFVLMNAGDTGFTFRDVYLPEGTWKLVGTNEKVDVYNGVRDKGMTRLKGGSEHDVSLGPKQLRIWVNKTR